MKVDTALVSPAAASRLPLYVRTLRELSQSGIEQVSSQELAGAMGLEAHQIRKDLSRIGNLGKRGVGYQVDDLIDEITSYLHLCRVWRVALVGCGRLGSALTHYLLASGGAFQLVAIFDCSARRVGTKIGDLEVRSWKKVPAVFREKLVDMVVIATPPLAAQSVVDMSVQGGAKLILNFAPVNLSVPEGVIVRNVDLTNEMLALSLQLPARKPARPRAVVRPTVPWVTA